MKKNLILTGMMGVGKSTIGKSLSKKLNMNFIDIDKLIEKNENSTIPKIFEENGEEYFRNLEKKISLLEIKKTESVISLGGGAFMNKEIRSIVLNTCCSFWLDLKIKTIEDRIKNSNKRPLLNKKNLRFSLNEIYNNRKDIYNLANHKIDCNKITLVDVVDKIINLYANKRN
ncbi:MAG: shikimate kinase/shikimate kinase / 3-dehydroquinate synthase [Pelagibacterales bacterium]|nr:shikimate kinase/shikimate kinase / 3-dehydroquinate synthase [Pelagibacterales bacterium]